MASVNDRNGRGVAPAGIVTWVEELTGESETIINPSLFFGGVLAPAGSKYPWPLTGSKRAVLFHQVVDPYGLTDTSV